MIVGSGHVATLIREIDRYLASLQSAQGVTAVRQSLAPYLDQPAQARPVPENAVVAQHLGTALDALRPSHPALAQAIGAACGELEWISYRLYDPDQIGAAFIAGHAYAELIGPGAAVDAPELALGVFIIAPHILYRDHRHPAPELYAPLTGPHGWRFGVDQPLMVKPAHQPVWNQPMAPHMTKVGPVPFLCIYGWTADVEAPATVIPADDWPALEALRLEV